jgi:hypothetical protein
MDPRSVPLLPSHVQGVVSTGMPCSVSVPFCAGYGMTNPTWCTSNRLAARCADLTFGSHVRCRMVRCRWPDWFKGDQRNYLGGYP